MSEPASKTIVEGRMGPFKIPVMSIQNESLGINHHPKIIALRIWLVEKVKKERDNWGIKGPGFAINYALDRQWFPVFSFTNSQLASAFVEYLAIYKPWTEKGKKEVSKENTACCDNCPLRGIDGGPSPVMTCEHPGATDMGYIISWNRDSTSRFSKKCPKQEEMGE